MPRKGLFLSLIIYAIIIIFIKKYISKTVMNYLYKFTY